MLKQIDKNQGNKNTSITNDNTQRANSVRKGVVLKDNRKVSFLTSAVKERDGYFIRNDDLKLTSQLMKQSNSQSEIRKRRDAMGKIQPPELIREPEVNDVDTARSELASLKAKIEQAVVKNELKTQTHEGCMTELRARFHNDCVWRRFRGGVDKGHADRTSEVLSTNILRKALIITKDRARKQRADIDEQIKQL
ncbi:TPA: hypothetical protein QCG56_003025 [Enterobacter cancerogenus]|nr:hypothetical protein [Enterobacter cancerogenus]HDR2166154.1 hypothetical protein [Enterobacter cancerogenus]HDR2268735.1 hypothetical protein [Enterobacter cancerogenus]